MNAMKMAVKCIISSFIILIFSSEVISPLIEPNFQSIHDNFAFLNTQSKILYVGGSGEGNYSRIQDAIDNASDGDIIFVYSGVYYEHVKIKKSIKLIGENKNETIIDAYNHGTCVEIRRKNVLISNFTIRNAGNFPFVSCGIYGSGENIKILNCKIINNEYYGIWLWHSENASISNCEINYNSWAGIWIASGYNVSIENCKIIKNGISASGVKIKIKNCDICHGEIGISGLFIKIDSCDIHNGSGIDIGATFFLNIENCKIYSNSWAILVEFSAFIIINKCEFYDNKEYDIVLFSTFFNYIHGNNFDSSRRNIFFMDTAFNLWLRNYWKGWFIPLPKPIFGILFAFVLKGTEIYIPWIEFDWLPKIFPHNALWYKT